MVKLFKKPMWALLISLVIMVLTTLTMLPIGRGVFVAQGLDFNFNTPFSNRNLDINTARITEQVVYEREEITVTALYLETQESGDTDLRLLMKNHTDDILYIRMYYLAINGVMYEWLQSFSVRISPGEQSSESLELRSFWLVENQIATIGTMEFYFRVESGSGGGRLFCTEVITIQTNMVDEVVQEVPAHAIEVLNQDDVVIYFLGFNQGPLLMYPEAWFLVKNNRDRMIQVAARDVSLNGSRVQGSMRGGRVLQGKSAYVRLDFDSIDRMRTLGGLRRIGLRFDILEQRAFVAAIDYDWGLIMHESSPRSAFVSEPVQIRR
ncbi:MAG: hypothetical protein FWE25_10285 [Lachnospiraceae bacterium]|nr:hypothetical protein [Lachnospiraceae bacterium]